METMLQNQTQWHLFNLVRIGKVQETNGRICPFLTSSLEQLTSSTLEKVNVINAFYESMEGKITEANQPYVDILPNLKLLNENSLGYALYDLYTRNRFPMIGTIGAFPAKYIMIHDAHHLLLDIDTSIQGEIDICAFEGGLSGGNTANSIVPLLAQIKAFESDFDINRVARAWEIGCGCTVNLLESWNILDDLNKSIEDLRKEFNLSVLN